MRYAPVLLLLIVLAAPVAAQSNTEVYVDQATGAIGAPTSQAFGRAALGPVEALAASLQGRNLTGETNVLVVTQNGSGNALALSQIGQNNAVGLIQNGDGNVTDLAQLGDNNVVLSAIDGSGNVLRDVQQGDNNSYSLVLSGDETTHTVLQLGSDNVAEQTVAPGLLPASIEQRGNGLEVYVERN
ncbi:MAG TPA: hypothetical protein VF576_14320 [Rubricoccaceae bacterium]